MMGRLVIVGLCVVAAILCAYGWSAMPHTELSRGLAERVQKGAKVVDFAELAPFPWDRLHVFGPYTSRELIQEELGFRWAGVRWTSVGSSEGVHLVVLVRSGSVLSWFEHPRNQGDFYDESINRNGHAREDAKFHVLLPGGGFPALVHEGWLKAQLAGAKAAEVK